MTPAPDGPGERPGLRTRAGDAIFRKVAGEDPASRRRLVHATPGPRWFEEGSPITRVHGDASMFVGGLRALLLQTLHPGAMAGVAQHSDYRGDPDGRLVRTAEYIALTTFGAVPQAEQAIHAVRVIHERVRGVRHDGVPYAASDPELLLWVHVAEVDSFLAAHDALGSDPLVGPDRDEYVAQAAVPARLLGVLDPPTDEAGLRSRLEACRPDLEVTPEALEVVHFLRLLPRLSRVERPAYRGLFGAAAASLPDWAAEPLGLTMSPLAQRLALDVGGRVTTTGIRWAMAPGHAHARELARGRGGRA